MIKFFATIFCVLFLAIIADAGLICNESILMGKGNETLSDYSSKRRTILSGTAEATPRLNSNQVFLFVISQYFTEQITYILDQEYSITAIGIRQLFEDEDICPKSNEPDLAAIYNITYTISADTQQRVLEYPIGTKEMGRINPQLFLPYQNNNSNNKTTLKIAVKPTNVKTLTIRKETVAVNGIINNAGKYCLQFDLYGCPANKQKESGTIVLEYQMPEPAMSSDEKYTGLCSEKSCTGGIGKLVDRSSGGKTESVLWELNGPEYDSGIIVGDKNLSVLEILFIFNDVYFIETIHILGVQNYGELQIGTPAYIGVNGIYFSTEGQNEKITLSPWVNTNSLLLTFFLDVNKTHPRIAISEISFNADPILTKNEDMTTQPSWVQMSTISAVALLLLILLSVSIVTNCLLIARKNCKLCGVLVGKRVCGNVESQQPNTYQASMDEVSAYETIREDRRASTVYSEPEFPEKSFNPNTSVVEMPNNPTYVSSMPLVPVPEDKVSGYSHLEFSKQNEDVPKEAPELPEVKARPKGKSLTAAQRRSSYLDQHMLSDLK